MDLFKNLNTNQIEAVKAINGPVIVVAGAGSGKTRVLTHRLCYLVENGVDSSNILAVTFTNKAAKEMKDRVDKMIDSDNRATIMTFHSLCARILRKEASYLGYKSNFEIYDDEGKLTTLREYLGAEWTDLITNFWDIDEFNDFFLDNFSLTREEVISYPLS